jgi:hypothetical protein
MIAVLLIQYHGGAVAQYSNIQFSKLSCLRCDVFMYAAVSAIECCSRREASALIAYQTVHA